MSCPSSCERKANDQGGPQAGLYANENHYQLYLTSDFAQPPWLMQNNTPTSGELLACGKVARAYTFPCGHVILTVEQLRIGFTQADFREFAQTVALALANLEDREVARRDWGLYM